MGQLSSTRIEVDIATIAASFLDTLRRGEHRSASALILRAVDAGASLEDIYLRVFQTALYEIGRLWEEDAISVAEEHYFTGATQAIMSALYPRLFSGASSDRKFVGTSVNGNLHEVGVRMVSDFFEMSEWDTYFLGASTPTADVVRTVREQRADVLGVSAMLDEHVPAAEELIRALRASGLDDVIVIVGGQAFRSDPDLYRKIGADGVGTTAGTGVVDQAAEILRENRR